MYRSSKLLFADDLTAAGHLKDLLKWWLKLENVGPRLGHFPKASKSWLVVKLEKYELAKAIFSGTNINITIEGKRHLGAAIGSPDFKRTYMTERMGSTA